MLETIASLWWLWLLGWMGFGVIGTALHFKNIFGGEVLIGLAAGEKKAIAKFGIPFCLFFLAGTSGSLFSLSIIVMLIDYIKG